jgi:hypothetical protein
MIGQVKYALLCVCVRLLRAMAVWATASVWAACSVVLAAYIVTLSKTRPPFSSAKHSCTCQLSSIAKRWWWWRGGGGELSVALPRSHVLTLCRHLTIKTLPARVSHCSPAHHLGFTPTHAHVCATFLKRTCPTSRSESSDASTLLF